jgi:DNA-binding LacI/PurR family transcriptional regulator
MPGVRDDTKSQVQAAVLELNYVAPKVKRGPRLGSTRKARIIERTTNSARYFPGVAGDATAGTGTIAVIAVGEGMDWLQLPVMAACVSGISRAASDAGLKVLLTEMPDFRQPRSLLVNREIDGAMVFISSRIKPGDFSQALALLERHVPVVWVMGGDAGAYPVDHVIPDDRAIARLAFDYLTKHGCHHLAFMTRNPAWVMMPA